MTEPEFKKWSTDFLCRFPGINEWLKRNSPDVSATLKSWRKTLEPISLVLAVTVMDRMESGQLEVPTGYERDKTAILIRNYAERIIQDQQKALEIERRDKGYGEYRRLNRLGSMPIRIGDRKLLNECCRLWRHANAQEWDEHQRREYVHREMQPYFREAGLLDDTF